MVRGSGGFVYDGAGRDSSRGVLRVGVFVVPGAENDSGGMRKSGGPRKRNLT